MGQAVLLLFNIVVSHPCTFDSFPPGLRHDNLFIVTNLLRDLAVRFLSNPNRVTCFTAKFQVKTLREWFEFIYQITAAG